MAVEAISQEVFRARLDRLREELAARGGEAAVITSPRAIAWLTGYFALPTERPFALVVPRSGGAVAFVPGVEWDAASQVPTIEEVWRYYEYPGPVPPLSYLARRLGKLGLKRVIADAPGWGRRWGYQGPSLAELLPQVEIVVDPDLVERNWRGKSPEEIELLRVSGEWADRAHRMLQEALRPGVRELSLSLSLTARASQVFLEAMGEGYGGFSRGAAPVHVGFVSGERTALPHAMSRDRELKRGDVIVTGVAVYLWGYSVELERTLILGPPTPKQARYFSAMVEAQEAGLSACGPGVPLREVDRRVREVLLKRGLGKFLRHHTGHHLGWEGHEPPYIDAFSAGEMRPGQVFSIEPGVYIPGLGGFRHSDTVLITEEGTKLLTHYPRDLKSLALEV